MLVANSSLEGILSVLINKPRQSIKWIRQIITTRYALSNSVEIPDVRRKQEIEIWAQLSGKFTV